MPKTIKVFPTLMPDGSEIFKVRKGDVLHGIFDDEQAAQDYACELRLASENNQ